jgi:ABC-type uncharacterized transport system permease subunit
MLQAVVAKRYGASNEPVDTYLPNHIYKWGGITIQEQRIYIVAITLVVTFGLWAWTRYTRVGLAINASAQNERAALAFQTALRFQPQMVLWHARCALWSQQNARIRDLRSAQIIPTN